VGFLDVRHHIEYMGLYEADRAGRLDPVAAERRYRSFHLVSPGGKVLSGAKALQRLVSLLPGGFISSTAFAKCPPVFAAASFAYQVLSRLHDGRRCAHPSLRRHPGVFHAHSGILT